MSRQALVGSRELKTRLGRYLRHVRAGNRLVITDRGEPVAELRPLDRTPSEEAALDRLRSLGTVTRLESRSLASFRPVDAAAKVALAVVEGRDDRF